MIRFIPIRFNSPISKMAKKFKAIFFDIDNTLVDFIRMKEACCSEAMDVMIGAGLNISKEKGMKILFNLHGKYGMEYPHIFEKLLKELKGKIDYRIVSYGVIAYRKIRENYLVSYPNVVSTLKKLKKNYRLGVISDAPVMQAWMRLVGMKLDNFFEVVVTKADSRRQKTSPAPFKRALKEMNVSPFEAIMVGDRISRDIVTPKKLGMKTIYARYGDLNPPSKSKSGADAEIEDISEVVSVVREWEKEK